jgi:hypothetical protein
MCRQEFLSDQNLIAKPLIVQDFGETWERKQHARLDRDAIELSPQMAFLRDFS